MFFILGLGFRPMYPDPEVGSLIWYKANDSNNTAVWLNQIDQYLEGENVN